MAPNRNAPAAGATAAKAAALDAQQISAPTVSQANGAVAEQEDTYCPCCGLRAQLLPEGQGSPTERQLYESCWIPSGGSPRSDAGKFCGRHQQMAAGLLARLLRCNDRDWKDSYESVAPATGDRIVLEFLRFAQQHPLVSDGLLSLLVARLYGVSLWAWGPAAIGGSRAQLLLDLRGTGAAQTIYRHHRAELQHLLADLLCDGRDVFSVVWQGDGDGWDYFQPRRFRTDEREPDCSDIGGTFIDAARIESVRLMEPWNQLQLTWPGLEVARG